MPNSSTILVVGSHGQLGQSIKCHADVDNASIYTFVFVSRNQLDLSNDENIEKFFQKQRFDIIINCAAYTAVDKAEHELDLANQINHLAIKKLADIALQQGTKLIHISTDHVFNGQNYKPYNEADEPEPQNVYGLTKFRGEQALLKIMLSNALIIRTSWVYSEFGHNFVKTMLKLGEQRDSLTIISDQIGTPTYAADLAQAIITIITSQPFNQVAFKSAIYHYSNEGVCSWYDFAKAIFEHNQIPCQIKPIETKDYPTPAIRPHYSVLNKTQIKLDYGLAIPYWKDSVWQCLNRLQVQDK